MSTSPAHAPTPPWNDYVVATFAGQHDTHVDTGEDYDTITLASLFALKPQAKSKMAGNAFLPSSHYDGDARSHEVQRERGAFVALVGDIDKADLPLESVRDVVDRFADGAAWLIYSSAHSRDGDRRWRVVIPLCAPIPFTDWYDAQTAFFTFMEGGGVPMDHAMSRAAQPVYLPNVPQAYKDGTPLRDRNGEPIYYQAENTGTNAPGLDITRGAVSGGMASIRQQRAADDREREILRKAAAERFANRPQNDSNNIIERFNESTSIATMLELCGYEQSPRLGDDWRSPQQSGETYATRIIEGKWVSLSASDAASGLGSKCKSGCFGDAYDLYVHYKHGGDHKNAYRELGREQRGHNVVEGNFRSDQDGDPGWQEMPEYASPLTMDEVGETAGTRARASVVGEAAPQPMTAPDEGMLPFVWMADMKAQLEGFWLIKKLLPAIGIAVIYGHPGSGKTFLALDWAMHIAFGWDWKGRKVKQGLVVYVCAEGVPGLNNRVDAFKKHYNVDGGPFLLIPTPIDMQAPDADVKKLVKTITFAANHVGMSVSAVFIDTISKTFGAGKENTDDMVGYINNCQGVASYFECLTIPVHHRPKDADSDDLRGHSSLRGNIDTSILVDVVGETKRWRVKKQKDGDDNLSGTFQLKVLELGVDEDGVPVTSCVCIDSGVQPEDVATEAKPNRLSDGCRTVLRALDDLLVGSGFMPPPSIPETEIDLYRVGKVVRFEQWRDKCVSEAGTDRDIKRDTLKRNFNRAVITLRNLNIVRVWEDYAWRTFEAGTNRDNDRDILQPENFQAGTNRDKPGHPFRGVSRFVPVDVPSVAEGPNVPSEAERAAAREALADDRFLSCLDAATDARHRVSHQKGVNYAPSIFDLMPEAGGVSKTDLERAMHRLRAAGQIGFEIIVELGPDNHPRKGIARVRSAQATITDSEDLPENDHDD